MAQTIIKSVDDLWKLHRKEAMYGELTWAGYKALYKYLWEIDEDDIVFKDGYYLSVDDYYVSSFYQDYISDKRLAELRKQEPEGLFIHAGGSKWIMRSY